MFKRFFEWLEGDISRGRKVVLISTIFVFLIITIAVFGAAIIGVNMNVMIQTLYATLVSLVVGIYGFYTGTKAESD